MEWVKVSGVSLPYLMDRKPHSNRHLVAKWNLKKTTYLPNYLCVFQKQKRFEQGQSIKV